MSALTEILDHKIIAIVRGANPDDVLKIAEALYTGGVRLLEITMNSDEPLRVIREVAQRMEGKMTIGAGTVLDLDALKGAVEAGAKFILSPVMDLQVIKAARDFGVVCVPGAYTATEIFAAYINGADIVKVFPASSPRYLKDIAGPLPQVPLMPTGGVSVENILDFKKAGAVAFGIGSALVDTKRAVDEEYLVDLTKRAAAFVAAIQ
jgi:2-dehydro-3-deoxyphosphogluconate aldolase/(4S)-4-hydroxy-2-oxoglutarate aldolase